MTKDEALKLALEALESGVDTQIGLVAWTEYDSCLISDAITAINEALAQPAQEPVAWIEHHKAGDNLVWEQPNKGTPLYTAQPQRLWVGLTEDEIKAMDTGTISNSSFYAGALWADAKLKEKNT